MLPIHKMRPPHIATTTTQWNQCIILDHSASTYMPNITKNLSGLNDTSANATDVVALLQRLKPSSEISRILVTNTKPQELQN
mmetsp:Transcript_34295/g.50423  ORF Transcript_34295/g.50423 Transcript_34295/m.50423 type:complete len:82 (+) Transcript_34295:16-261(+)